MIAIGADHGGYLLKEFLKDYLTKKGIEYKDFGTDSEDSVDYPDIADPVCGAVLSGECECGVLLCGTGIGISIAANKHKGIRCALVHDPFTGTLCKEHNNANIIAMGGRVTGPDLAAATLDAYLAADFLGGRHERRVGKITAIENR